MSRTRFLAGMILLAASGLGIPAPAYAQDTMKKDAGSSNMKNDGIRESGMTSDECKDDMSKDCPHPAAADMPKGSMATDPMMKDGMAPPK